MSDLVEKHYVVRFNPPETSQEYINAVTVGVEDGYLIFGKADGTLAALFAVEVVESWAEEISN